MISMRIPQILKTKKRKELEDRLDNMEIVLIDLVDKMGYVIKIDTFSSWSYPELVKKAKEENET
jgi:hypothetical protein